MILPPASLLESSRLGAIPRPRWPLRALLCRPWNRRADGAACVAIWIPSIVPRSRVSHVCRCGVAGAVLAGAFLRVDCMGAFAASNLTLMTRVLPPIR